MDEILFLLLKYGAQKKPVKLTTAQIGAETGMSQQNASRRLNELEENGFIERKDGIRLTKKAQDELAVVYSMLKCAFEKKALEISGTITKGFEEGKYYLSLPGYRNQIREKFGFDPFPGTLNIKLDEREAWKRQHLQQLDGVLISGFNDGKRTFGNLLAYRCRLDKHDCFLIVPLRTHHGPEIIELISPFSIKKKFGLKDGDMVRVII